MSYIVNYDYSSYTMAGPGANNNYDNYHSSSSTSSSAEYGPPPGLVRHLPSGAQQREKRASVYGGAGTHHHHIVDDDKTPTQSSYDAYNTYPPGLSFGRPVVGLGIYVGDEENDDSEDDSSPPSTTINSTEDMPPSPPLLPTRRSSPTRIERIIDDDNEENEYGTAPYIPYMTAPPPEDLPIPFLSLDRPSTSSTSSAIGSPDLEFGLSHIPAYSSDEEEGEELEVEVEGEEGQEDYYESLHVPVVPQPSNSPPPSYDCDESEFNIGTSVITPETSSSATPIPGSSHDNPIVISVTVDITTTYSDEDSYGFDRGFYSVGNESNQDVLIDEAEEFYGEEEEQEEFEEDYSYSTYFLPSDLFISPNMVTVELPE